ncbi:hypothetical protein J7M28_01675 [bacterium]|nr:hypothetical protein [bacterium]
MHASAVVMSRVCGKPNCRCTKGHKHESLYVTRYNEAVNQYDLDRAYKHDLTAILFMVLTLAIALTLVNAFYLLNLKPEERSRLAKKSLVEQFKEGFRHALETFAPT